jgi:hypothetical protein
MSIFSFLRPRWKTAEDLVKKNTLDKFMGNAGISESEKEYVAINCRDAPTRLLFADELQNSSVAISVYADIARDFDSPSRGLAVLRLAKLAGVVKEG